MESVSRDLSHIVADLPSVTNKLKRRIKIYDVRLFIRLYFYPIYHLLRVTGILQTHS